MSLLLGVPGFILALAAAGPSNLTAQSTERATPPPMGGGSQDARDDIVTVIDGTVLDFAVRASGDLVYCTDEGEVGTIPIGQGGASQVLAPIGTFINQTPRAVAATPGDDVAVLCSVGDIFVMNGGTLPANLVYDDVYMVLDPTDMICDDAGNFILASSSPSNGQRAVNWISADGSRWAYYFVRHQLHMPVQLAYDPVTTSIVFSDETGGGSIHRVLPGDKTRPIVGFNTTTQPGVESDLDDGDIVFKQAGDYYWATGNRVYLHERATGQTTLFREFDGTVTAIALAGSSGHIPTSTPTPSGFSLYVASVGVRTVVYEFPEHGFPGPRVASNQGWVPGRGFNTGITPDFQVFEMAADNDGHLLIGGALFSTTFHLQRVELPSKNVSVIADDTMGILGIIEGLVAGMDGTIYLLTREGEIQAITENPFTITTLFSDPGDQINAAKDLGIGVDGRFYIAERAGWGLGGIVEVDPMNGFSSTRIITMSESRGIAPNPAGGIYATEWNGTGFEGGVVSIDLGSNSYFDPPGFRHINYTNGPVWGDGDILVDATGAIYTVSEDDWSLARYIPGQLNIERIGSDYVNHISGLVIAPSSDGVTSSTGWSLYVSEWNRISERPESPGPGPTFIDNSAAFRASAPGPLTGPGSRRKLR